LRLAAARRVTSAIILLSLVSAARLGELWLARRNTARLLAAGGFESGSEHYPLIVVLHALWLASLWWLGWNQAVNFAWLLVFLSLQVLRVWVLLTLGRRWTTRIISVPGESLVAGGPFRFFSHPNYAVVVGEIATLPLCLGLQWLALVFSVANAMVLMIRVKVENAALARTAK
jgi:methyltransferase